MRKVLAFMAALTIGVIVAANIRMWLEIRTDSEIIQTQKEKIERQDSIIQLQDSIIFRWRCLYEPDYMLGEV